MLCALTVFVFPTCVAVFKRFLSIKGEAYCERLLLCRAFLPVLPFTFCVPSNVVLLKKRCRWTETFGKGASRRQASELLTKFWRFIPPPLPEGTSPENAPPRRATLALVPPPQPSTPAAAAAAGGPHGTKAAAERAAVAVASSSFSRSSAGNGGGGGGGTPSSLTSQLTSQLSLAAATSSSSSSSSSSVSGGAVLPPPHLLEHDAPTAAGALGRLPPAVAGGLQREVQHAGGRRASPFQLEQAREAAARAAAEAAAARAVAQRLSAAAETGCPGNALAESSDGWRWRSPLRAPLPFTAKAGGQFPLGLDELRASLVNPRAADDARLQRVFRKVLTYFLNF